MAKKTKDIQYYEATGRRRESVALVRMHLVTKDKPVTVHGKKYTKGQIIVNDKPVEEFFPGEVNKSRYLQPLTLTENADRFVITIKVQGGGKIGQLEAVIHGIARALIEADTDAYRPALKSNGLLTRDPRIKERRKVGRGGKARRQKQSPKR